MRLTRRKLLKAVAPAVIIPLDIPEAMAQVYPAQRQSLFRTWYSPQSLLRARPLSPTLGSGQINASQNYPGVADCGVSGSVGSGANYSCSVPTFHADANDSSMDVVCAGIGDELDGRTVRVPRWPRGAFSPPGNPATADKEAVIYDSVTGLIHQFWSLQGSGKSWTAQNYAVSSTIANNQYWGGGASQGLGFGTPARPYNIRAAGIGPLDGALRIWELYAGTYPKHALVMSLDPRSITQNSPTSGPPPVFPATGQDGGFPYIGRGPNSWPIGTLFMLPSNFNLSELKEQGSILIAQTLMNYGAYVVDTGPGGNTFVAEMYDIFPNKQNFHPRGGAIYPGGPVSTIPFWDRLWSGVSERFNSDGRFQNSTDLATIQAALKPVTTVGGWLDANGTSFTPTQWKDMNLLSMRGPYTKVSGSPSGRYDTAQNAYVVPSRSAAFTIYARRDSPVQAPSGNGPWQDWSDSNGWFHSSYSLNEGDPIPGRTYTLTPYGTGNLTARLLIQNQGLTSTYFDSGNLSPGQMAKTFNWPDQSATSTLVQIANPTNGGGGSIRLELVGN